MALELEDIRALFDAYGAKPYGMEAVTQLEHALQAAYLAETEGAPRELVIAAFLHDLGHMIGLKRRADGNASAEEDDLHQFAALPFLRPVLPGEVVEPIGLHVEAKRCLCAIDPGYHARLSPQSIRSLEQQGGVHTEAQAMQFQSQPFSSDAMRLRKWDDAAKVPGVKTPSFDHYFSMVASIYREPVAQTPGAH